MSLASFTWSLVFFYITIACIITFLLFLFFCPSLLLSDRFYFLLTYCSLVPFMTSCAFCVSYSCFYATSLHRYPSTNVPTYSIFLVVCSFWFFFPVSCQSSRSRFSFLCRSDDLLLIMSPRFSISYSFSPSCFSLLHTVAPFSFSFLLLLPILTLLFFFTSTISLTSLHSSPFFRALLSLRVPRPFSLFLTLLSLGSSFTFVPVLLSPPFKLSFSLLFTSCLPVCFLSFSTFYHSVTLTFAFRATTFSCCLVVSPLLFYLFCPHCLLLVRGLVLPILSSTSCIPGLYCLSYSFL